MARTAGPAGRFLAELGGLHAVSKRAEGSARCNDVGLHDTGGSMAGFGLNAEGQGCISRDGVLRHGTEGRAGGAGY